MGLQAFPLRGEAGLAAGPGRGRPRPGGSGGLEIGEPDKPVYPAHPFLLQKPMILQAFSLQRASPCQPRESIVFQWFSKLLGRGGRARLAVGAGRGQPSPNRPRSKETGKYDRFHYM